jgi:uncharacterized protein (TIGR02391 family)
MELSQQQRTYLQTIFDHFHRSGAWPMYRDLERHYDQIQSNVNVEDVATSLPAGLSNAFAPSGEAMLTVPAIRLCQNSASDLRDFVLMIQLCVRKYLESGEEAPQFSSGDLYDQLLMPELALRKIGLLVQVESGIYRYFTRDDEAGSWSFEIARAVLRFQGVTTIDDYLRKRDLPDDAISTPVQESAQKNPALEMVEELQLHPDIRLQCWNLYTLGNYDNAVLNATKLLEVRVREKASLGSTVVGTDLMRQAFSLNKTRLRYSSIAAEQQGMMELLTGMIAVFKNPQSHRFVGIHNKMECLAILLMCSALLYIIDNTEYVGTS